MSTYFAELIVVHFPGTRAMLAPDARAARAGPSIHVPGYLWPAARALRMKSSCLEGDCTVLHPLLNVIIVISPINLLQTEKQIEAKWNYC